MKKYLFMGLSICLMFSVFSLGSQEETGYEAVDGLDYWTHQFDIQDAVPGRYNLIIRGTDKAGNIAYGGPIDVIIDPDSDLPVVNISYPVENMRVGSHLYAVGTCVDDDAVDFVELRLNDESWIKADGADFWVHDFDVDNMEDGRHQLSARGVDVKGIYGHEHTVSFYLDREAPAISVSSHENGDLLTGRSVLEGSVFDANGVKALSLSKDGGKHYDPLRIRYDRNQDMHTFSYRLDTRDFEDGALILWFKAEDTLGSVGRTAFLVFVDNTDPEFSIETPLEEEGLHGRVSFAGVVRDEIGIESLTYSWEGGEGEINLIPGNPYWIQEFDFSGITRNRTNIDFRITDLAGNLVQKRYTVHLDREAAKPQLSLSLPYNEQIFDSALRLSGYARDSAGIQALYYKIGRQDPVRLDNINEAFHILIDDIPAGTHGLEVWAEDANGVIGDKQRRSFTIAGHFPQISIDTVQSGEDKQDFVPGFSIDPVKNYTIQGTLNVQSSISELTYQFGSREAVSIRVRNVSDPFAIPVPQNLYGIVPLSVKMIDAFGREAELRTFLSIKDITQRNEDWGLHFLDARIRDRTVVLTDEQAFYAYFSGLPIDSLRLEPENDFLEWHEDNGFITIRPRRSGVSEETKIVVIDERGHRFESEAIVFQSDAIKPEIRLNRDNKSPWIQNSLAFAGTVSDDLSIAKLEYSLNNDDNWTDLVFTDNEFSTNVMVSDMDDGPILIRVRAVDTVGNTAEDAMVLIKDTTAPELVFWTPYSEDYVSGEVNFSGKIKDSGNLEEIVFIHADGHEETLPVSKFFNVRTNLQGLTQIPAELGLRVTDAAGNSSFSTANLTRNILNPLSSGLEDAAGSSRPSFQLLSSNTGTYGTILFAGRFANLEYAKSIRYELGEETNTIPVNPGNPYWIHEINLDNFSGRSVRVNIHIEYELPDDRLRTVSERIDIQIDRSLDKPEIMLSPLDETTREGDMLFLAGSVLGRRGPASVELKMNREVLEQSIPAYTFLFALPQAHAGTHNFELTSQSTDNAQRTTKEVRTKVEASAPQLFVPTVKSVEEEFMLINGAAFVIERNSSIVGTVVSSEAIRNVDIAFNRGESQSFRLSSTDSGFSYSAAIPSSLPFGRNIVEISVQSPSGQTDIYECLFYRIAGETAEPVNDPESIIVYDQRLNDDIVHLLPGTVFHAFFNGRPLESVSFLDDFSELSVTHNENNIEIRAFREGIFEDCILAVETIDGDIFQSQALTFKVDATAPDLSILSPHADSWHQNSVNLELEIFDSNGIQSLEYSLDYGETYRHLNHNERMITQLISLEDIPDGGVLIKVKAVDNAGLETVKSVAINKDTVAPDFSQVTPLREDFVNGRISLSGLISDKGKIASVEFSSDGEAYEELSSDNFFNYTLDLSIFDEIPESFFIRITDLAGNETIANPYLQVRQEDDIPQVFIQVPAEREIMRSDFKISGMAFDDDAIGAIFYRFNPSWFVEALAEVRASDDLSFDDIDIHGQAAETEDLDTADFTRLDGRNNFSVPVSLSMLSDNEHLFEVFAEDIYGVRSPLERRVIRISLEEPKAFLESPNIESTVKDIIRLTGFAQDENGIASVSLSFDNGLSFQKAYGQDAWYYDFDTRVLEDGTHAVQMLVKDKYDTSARYVSLINIDNTSPLISLKEPVDAATYTDFLFIDGRVSDNMELFSLSVVLSALDEKGQSALEADSIQAESVLLVDLPLSEILNHEIAVHDLSPGWYNFRLEARDRADNVSYVSRNVLISETADLAELQLFFPYDQEALYGEFSVSGKMLPAAASNVSLLVNDLPVKTETVDTGGFFSFSFTSGELSDGLHTVKILTRTDTGEIIESESREIFYSEYGPTVSIESHRTGDYVSGRPWLSGTAGYGLRQELLDANPRISRDYAVTGVSVSFDNGRTFQNARGTSQWRYRLETIEFSQDTLTVLVRANFANGEYAVRRSILTIDNTAPSIEILSPSEGARLNTTIDIIGLATDNLEMTMIEANLRTGSKDAYEVPSFIQGMYLDFHALGLTVADIGFGFTFADDNVKVQFQAGYAPVGRFTGYVVGTKILAGIANIPFSYFFGPDLDFFSMNWAIGSNFSLIFEDADSLFNLFSDGADKLPVFISSLLVSWEYAHITSGWTFLPSFALYLDTEFWFISSDVSPTVVPRGTLGIRLNLF